MTWVVKMTFPAVEDKGYPGCEAFIQFTGQTCLMQTVENATHFGSREEAESGLLLMVARCPDLIGELEVSEVIQERSA